MEDKMMTKKEIQQEIEQVQKQLETLQEKLNNQNDEVPDILPLKYGEKIYCMATTGAILEESFRGDDYTDMGCALNRRYFKTREYAEMFSEKAQFIANLLHFKYLYDRDYKPNWDNGLEYKYFIYYDNSMRKYFQCATAYRTCRHETIYFSSEEIANKCADWLNKLGGRK
jgi:hypothetical protein